MNTQLNRSPEWPRPLNVLFVMTSMPVGGAETLLVNLVRRLNRQKVIPQIACLKELGPLGEEIASEVPVHHGLISHKYDVMVIRRLKQLMQQESFDAVITVGAGDKMFWGRLAARQARIPVILSALHSTGWPDGVGRLNRWLQGITDGFIAVAKPHGEFLVEFEKFPRQKVYVIPNGVDVERFRFCPQSRANWRHEFNIPDSAPVVGIVAALRPEKNHMLFLHAAGQVAQHVPESHFLIVGDGPQRDLLEKSVAGTRMQQRVHFAGSRPDIPGALSAMDVFSLTSHNEASPVSILEALSCERPVVATRVGSVPESVRQGKTGLLVEPGDAEELARRWTQLLRDPSVRMRMGAAGRQHVIQHGSLEVMVEGYEELIRERFEAKTGKRPVPNLGLPTNPVPSSTSLRS